MKSNVRYSWTVRNRIYRRLKSLRRGGRFSQAFGLSVLSLCGRLPDIDREGECSQENNATFDKLMRDFRGTPIPFAMELFL